MTTLRTSNLSVISFTEHDPILAAAGLNTQRAITVSNGKNYDSGRLVVLDTAVGFGGFLKG